MTHRLVPARFLDPRPAAEAAAQPIADAVNIPLAELTGRMHELPPRAHTILVAAAPELAERTVELLEAAGRHAAATDDFHRAESPGEVIGRLWHPTPWLETGVAALEPGRALDLACGTGRDAVFLAAAGWRVTAVDVLPDAIERGRDLERRYAPGAVPIQWRVADLERAFQPDGGPFDLVCCCRYFRRELVRAAAEWLRPGGSVLLECFTREHQQRFGRPAGAERVPLPGELPALLAPLEVVAYAEGLHEGVYTARLWARRSSRQV